ncbi:MAG: type I restriction enzyme HsdR N-terminal domain-containing protein [Bacteroidota bacterium]|nr:type I restriction enzyme HsdR N-terminal domain-containing protein [Bacteroidota bacterium]
MNHLNLPSFEYDINKNAKGQLTIFDITRKKHIILTPEEWVRQHFIQYLKNHLQYPVGHIKTESGITINKRKKRTDVIVYNKVGQPYIIIECKSFEIHLNENTLLQATFYNSRLNCPFLCITNGMVHYYFQNINLNWVRINELPKYNLQNELS